MSETNTDAKTDNLSDDVDQRLARLTAAQRTLLQRRLAVPQDRGYRLVAKSLRACGVTHVYGISGQPCDEILPACVEHQIRPLGVYHQSAAVEMALAHNYQAGRLVAAALVSAGPAATNAITGLLVARENGWPVIVLGGRQPLFQRLDVLPMVAPVSKYAVSVPSTGRIDACIREAYRIAASGRPGPAYLDMHADVLHGHARDVSADDAPPLPLPPTTIADTDVDAIAAALTTAQRPALLLGNGVRWGTDPQRLRALIEVLDLPFITTPMGRGFIPDDHSLCYNRARSPLQSRADLVLVLGAQLNWMFRNGGELARDARVLRIDAGAGAASDNPSDDASPRGNIFDADPGDFIDRLLDRLRDRQYELAGTARRRRVDAWRRTLNDARAEAETRLSPERQTGGDGRPMSAYRMMRVIQQGLPRDAILVSEGNLSMRVAQQLIPAYRPASRMDAGSCACMGVGVPFAIGAKVAQPNRPVVAIVGDYGFSLSAMELEVCVRYRLPVVVIIANNQGSNGALKQKSFPTGHERVTMFQPGLEYHRLMQMFGGRGVTVTSPEALKTALAAALAAGEPHCINVVIDPDTPLPPAWGEQNPPGPRA